MDPAHPPVYDLHEREWESYEALQDAFEWAIPEPFNTATYVCDRWAEADGDRVAMYVDSGGEGDRADAGRAAVTFADLQDRAGRLASYLASRGVGRGDRVAFTLPQSPELVVTCLATWKLGGVAVPFSTLYGRDGLRYRLEDSGADAFVVHDSAVDAFRGVEDDLDLGTVLTLGVESDAGSGPDGVGGRPLPEAIAEVDGGVDTVETDPGDPAVILYTSGTTGDPKGVLHAHRFLLANLGNHQLQIRNLDLRPGDLTATPVEWSWAGTLYVIVLPSLFYGDALVAHDRGSFDAGETLSLVERHGVTNFFAPTTVLRLLLQAEGTGEYDLSAVRVVSSGGESLDDDVRAEIRDLFGDVSINEAYGQTEAVSLVTGCESLFEPRPGTMGRASPGQDVVVLDPDTGDPVDPGEVGEIAVPYEDNPVCFLRYWGQPELTEEKVRDGYLLTEDLGRRDEDGYVGFFSRKDDVIISSGYRISPTEIEECLVEHGAVADVAVVGVPDEARGEIPKAFVVLAGDVEGSDDLAAELQSFVRERLAKYQYPRAVEFRPELPTTSTGKVRREDLREDG